MLKTEEEVIDGVKFKTTQLPAVQGFALLAKLAKVAGPVLAGLGAMAEDADGLELFPLLAKALEGISEDELTALALNVLKNTSAVIDDPSRGLRQVDLSSRDAVDLVFSGRLMTMLKAMLHAIKVNYGDFLEGSGLGAPSLPTPTNSAL